MAKLEKMLKKDLVKLVKELQAKHPVDNNTTETKKKEEKLVKVLYINTKATKESLYKSLMLLVYGVKPTKKVSKELMDKDIKTLTLYLQDTQGFKIEERNFYDIPEKKRPTNFHPKFSTYIYKK